MAYEYEYCQHRREKIAGVTVPLTMMQLHNHVVCISNIEDPARVWATDPAIMGSGLRTVVRLPNIQQE